MSNFCEKHKKLIEKNGLVTILDKCYHKSYLPTMLSKEKEVIFNIYEEITGHPIANKNCSSCVSKCVKTVGREYFNFINNENK